MLHQPVVHNLEEIQTPILRGSQCECVETKQISHCIRTQSCIFKYVGFSPHMIIVSSSSRP